MRDRFRKKVFIRRARTAQETGRLSLSRSCQLHGLSRQAVYQQLRRHKERQHTLAPVRTMVLEWRRLMPRMGTRKLYHLLKPTFDSLGIKLGRDGLFTYLREQRLLVQPKRRYTKTTDSKHWLKKHPNLLEDFTLSRPEQVLVSDITYVESGEGVHYLSLVTDAYSRKIMGYELSRDMKAEQVVKALHRAAKQRLSTGPLLHHSDRGLQYCSALYQGALQRYNIKPSMTDGYDCYQNALAERVNGILKQEFLLTRCQSFDELKCLVDESVDLYNRMRPHLSLGMKTPEEVHKKAITETAMAF